MRQVSSTMTERWLAEDKTGANRPHVRATVQKVKLTDFDYDTKLAPGGNYGPDRWNRKGRFRSVLFAQPGPTVEIPNILSFSWTRSTKQDVAEATMTILNVAPTPMGAITDEVDLPGFYTPTRGEADEGNPWGYDAPSAWRRILVPDRLVRTYEGYGVDWSKTPAEDENLLPSGCWLIDEVSINAEGNIELRMRDVGRLLIDRIVFPPGVPWREYPMSWSKIRNEQVPMRDALGGQWLRLRGKHATASSSNDAYIGAELTNAPYSHYVGPNGGVNGHTARHVLDQHDETYWRSTGQDSYFDHVWWQADLKQPRHIAGVRVRIVGGPFRVYVSVHNGKRWLGKGFIKYTPGVGNIDNGGKVKFIHSELVDRGRVADLIFRRKYRNVHKIRITFRRLDDDGMSEHPFHAGLRHVSIYTAPKFDDLRFGKGTVLKTVGNYSDYTDIIKYVCAWSGLFWPPPATHLDYQMLVPGSPTRIIYASPDNALPRGRAWGDFMNTGTAGIADLTVDLFDKQPLMDVIAHIRDIVGFNFFIDETGAAIWRMPNLWTLGNYLHPTVPGQYSGARTEEIIEITDDANIHTYSTRLSSRNLRERVFVADVTGKTGVVVRGYVPYPVRFQRVAGWTDSHFESTEECLVMADMIAAKQMFDFRRSTITIAGYPAIQIDDQIRIFERITNETHYHYVETISSELDMRAGTWTYTLETHWLGRNPESQWAVSKDALEGPTRRYLQTIGVI